MATTDPMDRSISPAVRTKTAPKAMRAIGVTCEMIEVAFWALRKPLSPIVTAKKAKTRANPR